MLPFRSNISTVLLTMVPLLDEHLLSMWSMCITMFIITYVNVCGGACVYTPSSSSFPSCRSSPWPSCARLVNTCSLCVSHTHHNLRECLCVCMCLHAFPIITYVNICVDACVYTPSSSSFPPCLPSPWPWCPCLVNTCSLCCLCGSQCLS